MRINDNNKTTFKSGGFYNLTNQIQENTLLNRGLLDVGGLAVPQIIMSNNKDEKIERGVMETIYFASSFLAPYLILPFFNKTFLKRNDIVRNFANNEKKIIEVSKKYLVKSTKEMVDGIRESAKAIEKEAAKRGKTIKVSQDFENVLARYEGREEKLRNDLLKAHEGVLFADFLTTALMWCATPWASMEVTKLRTKRSGFSATYAMIDEEQSKRNAEKHEREKKKKLLISALIAILPAVIFPKIVTKGLKSPKNNIIKKFAENFNYTKGIFPSKTVFAAIWILSDYPSAVLSSRDKYERRDRAIRQAAQIAVFFGSDFILNNIFGRLSDYFLKTEIMDKKGISEKSGFFKRLSMQPKTFSEIEDLKNITPELLKKTKNLGAGLYWMTLVANMLILGFGLPAVLNKMLRKSVKVDTAKQNEMKQS